MAQAKGTLVVCFDRSSLRVRLPVTWDSDRDGQVLFDECEGIAQALGGCSHYIEEEP